MILQPFQKDKGHWQDPYVYQNIGQLKSHQELLIIQRRFQWGRQTLQKVPKYQICKLHCILMRIEGYIGYSIKYMQALLTFSIKQIPTWMFPAKLLAAIPLALRIAPHAVTYRQLYFWHNALVIGAVARARVVIIPGIQAARARDVPTSNVTIILLRKILIRFGL